MKKYIIHRLYKIFITYSTITNPLTDIRYLLLLLSRFSRVRLTDGSPPVSPVPGILHARTLEWVAISFSNAWKWKVKLKSLSRVRLLATPWTAAYQAPLSMGFSRQKYLQLTIKFSSLTFCQISDTLKSYFYTYPLVFVIMGIYLSR